MVKGGESTTLSRAHAGRSWTAALSSDGATTTSSRDPQIEAFCDPLDLERAEFDATRRSNVLHEILRYHDELAHLEANDPTHAALSRSVRSQIQRLVEHETGS